METNTSENRNFNTISPSAKSLLLMKGHTDIPFAKSTAELIELPGKYTPDFENNDFTFWTRTFHFESRYRSVEQLLEGLPVKNILELSSGFSFRGLEFTRLNDYHYIDTDLPDMISTKKVFLDALKGENFVAKGKLELLPLNALDSEKFSEIVERFPKGEIAIINEGLLMYLDMDEKRKLCEIIKGILTERGGYWITADIYLKNKQEILDIKLDNKTKEFFEQHKIEENRFGSFNEAEAFFNSMGFVIDKEAQADYEKLSSLKYLLKNSSPEQLLKMRGAGRIQATWRLKLAGE